MKPKVSIEKSGTMPEKKFRAGAVSATVWKNESKKVLIHSRTIQLVWIETIKTRMESGSLLIL